jgi:hypothetical protein
MWVGKTQISTLPSLSGKFCVLCVAALSRGRTCLGGVRGFRRTTPPPPLRVHIGVSYEILNSGNTGLKLPGGGMRRDTARVESGVVLHGHAIFGVS